MKINIEVKDTPSLEPSDKDWEEEFDEKFGESYLTNICENAPTEDELWAIKSFFSTHRSKLIEEIKERVDDLSVKDWKRKDGTMCDVVALKDVQEILKDEK